MLRAFGRLKPGAGIPEAGRDLDDLAAQLDPRLSQELSDGVPPGARAACRCPRSSRATRRPTFLLLFGTVGLVLLLACANVANLMLARLTRRQQELALRSALGAGRGRLARQLLTESVLLALAGGALGLVVAAAGQRMLVHFAERFTPRASEIGISVPVLLFSLAVSVLVGIVLGLIPALAPRRALTLSLQEGRERTTAGAGRLRARNLLIVAQVAISFVLLAGAGLMLRTLWKLSTRGSRVPDRAGADLAPRPQLHALQDRGGPADFPPAPARAPGGRARRPVRGAFRDHSAERGRPRQQRPLPDRGPPSRRGRRDAPGRLPARHAGLLPHDRRADPAGPEPRGRRSCRRGDRRRHQPVDGAAPLALGGPGRPAHPAREPRPGGTSGVDDRRRRRGRAPVRPRPILRSTRSSFPLDQYPWLSTTCLLRTSAEPARMERVMRAAVHARRPGPARGPLPHARAGARRRARHAAADGDPARRCSPVSPS